MRAKSAGHCALARSSKPERTSCRAVVSTVRAWSGSTFRWIWQYALATRCDSARKRAVRLIAVDSANCACAVDSVGASSATATV